jgi:hypothetical protein
MKEEHLCDSCIYEFATCITGKIIFGIDKYPESQGTADADRVLECEGYSPTTKRENRPGHAPGRGEI